jgi:hypothetical protein
MPIAERVELAREMRNIYGSLKDKEKQAEMEAFLAENE